MLRSLDVEDLAPDTRSVAAARPLVDPRLWSSLGRSGASWGQYSRYKVVARLEEPAASCTCPSPKHPCKHAVALMLLTHEAPSAVPAGVAPAWVGEPRPVERAAARRPPSRESRLESVTEGLQELDLFLRDVARQGLAALQPRGYGPWDEMAARMVDAKAKGAARLLRDLGGSVASGRHGADWAEAALARLGRLALLCAAWGRDLPADELADLRTQAFGDWNAEELRTGWGVEDRWCVVGQRTEVDELSVQRTWLQGRATRRTALLLEFCYGEPVQFASGLRPGVEQDAELVFAPSAWPQRALIRDRQGLPVPCGALPLAADVDALGRAFAGALARNPWLDRLGVGLRRVVPLRREPRWLLRDAAGGCVPLRSDGEWRLLAVSGGRPVDVFGEWDGESFRPLGAWTRDGRFVALG